MRAGLDRSPADVAAMFDAVAARYDLTNDVLSVGMDRWWRRAATAAARIAPGMRVLDLAAGTGTSSAAFAAAGAWVAACDFSQGMLAAGRRRRPGTAFVAGDALALPFADDSFDVVTISFGLRNVQRPADALAELRRVARPGGRLVVCEFSRPVLPPLRLAYSAWLSGALPALARLVSADASSYDYLAESIAGWPAQPELAAMLSAAGWLDVRWTSLTGGIVALHEGTAPRA